MGSNVLRALLAGLLAGAAAAPAAEPQLYLVLDARNIVARRGVRLVHGPVTKLPANPLLEASAPWELRFDNMQPNVWWDPEPAGGTKSGRAGRWRCWYSSFTSCGGDTNADTCASHASNCSARYPLWGHGGKTGALLYAESDAGLGGWRKPPLGLVRKNGTATNIVLDFGPAGEGLGTGVYRDARAPASQRWRLFGAGLGGEHTILLGSSADGLRFDLANLSGTFSRLDTAKNVVFDTRTQRWIGYVRCIPTAGHTHPGCGQNVSSIPCRLRVQCYVESATSEFLGGGWGAATPTGLNTSSLTYQPDALVAWEYAGVFIGIANVFNPSWETDAVTPPGTANAVLAWSADGRQWEYLLPTESLIPRGRSGSWDCCSVFGAKQSPQRTPEYLAGDDHLILYYVGCNGGWEGPRACGLGMVHIGRHAFAGFAPSEATERGTLETAPARVSTGRLAVTATGGVRVSVAGVPSLSAEGCRAVDGTDVVVVWAGNTSLGDFVNGAVALTFHIPAGGVLYSYAL
eukprot:SAG22_NODE_1622_length_3962_cov_25.479420_2_plen_517_part_00